MFHRNIDEECSQRTLQSLKNNDSELKCLFSTVAFGMGVPNSKCGTCSSLGSSQVCLVLLARGWKGGRDGRSAYAVCFAYGRSLVKTIADEKTITIMRSALQRKTFIRFSVLENTGIKGSSGKWTKLHWQWGMPSFEMLHFLHTEIQQGSIRVWDPMMPEFYVKWDS